MKRVLSLLLPLLFALGCTSASGPRAGSGGPTPPPSGAVFLEGVVEGETGRLSLDGKALDLAAATITVDGLPAAAEDVQPGMVVGATAQATATALQVSDLRAAAVLAGPITALDAPRLRLTVLDRTVQVEAATVIVQKGQDRAWTTLSFADLKVGDAVAVYGFPQADGSLTASRIERRPAPAPALASVSGIVARLDTAAKTFQVDATPVDYAGATVAGTLANGVRVVAAGTFSGAVLKAVKVVVMPEPPPLPRVLKGPVSALDERNRTFSIGAVRVDYARAVVEGTLANGVWALVEGAPAPTAAANLLVAAKVKVLPPPPPPPSPWNGVAAGPITALDASGAFKAGTSAFWMDARTVITSLTPSLLPVVPQPKVGDWVLVGFDSGRPNADRAPYATKILIHPPGATVRTLIGPVSGFQGGARTFTLQGFAVQATAATRFVVGGRTVDAATFWGADRNGAVVQAEGAPSGAAFTAQVVMAP